MDENKDEFERLKKQVENLQIEVVSLNKRIEDVRNDFPWLILIMGVVGVLTTFFLGLGTITVGIEYLRTVFKTPWFALETKSILFIAATLIGSFILQIAYFFSFAHVIKRVAVLPIAFMLAYAVAFAFGFQIRPVTFGSFMADVMGIAYFPTILGLGVVKGIVAISSDSAQTACLLGYQAGAALGPDQILAASWEAIKNFLGYIFIPWKYSELRSHIWLVTEATQSGLYWQGSLNATSYGVGLGYIGTCAFHGAFRDWYGLIFKLQEESYGLVWLLIAWIESWLRWATSLVTDWTVD
ncbi:hypothetical protein [Neorhizobium galegae]|uniref:hypothetical protein n=1 Tax=Neorhizobium galegae TaxID=399 RepID=UPI0021077324|nr:hypothetical protein [Neorhizobium galegae]MCQ1855356.1 hypothetical protein [Neorhizobium galegae]